MIRNRFFQLPQITTRVTLMALGFSYLWIQFARTLIMRGTFFDGLTYSYLSINNARQIGDFWRPTFDLLHPHDFFEHPPLHFWFQGLFYRALGSSIWVDKIFSTLIALLVFGVISKLWKQAHSSFLNSEIQDRKSLQPRIGLSWMWPVFCFGLSSIALWSLRYPMLENTLLVTTSSTIWLYLTIAKPRPSQANSWIRRGASTGVLALGTFVSFLVKGPVGVFTLITPLLVAFSFCITTVGNVFVRSLVRSAFDIFLVLLWLVGLGLLLTRLFPQSTTYFQVYFQQQVLASLAGAREAITPVTDTAGRLLSELAPVFIIPFALGRNRKTEIQQSWKVHGPWILFFLLTGSSASLPLLVSPKQRGFYFVPSMLSYALASALLFESTVKARIDQWQSLKWSRAVGVVLTPLIIVGIAIDFTLHLGEVGRDPIENEIVRIFKDELHAKVITLERHSTAPRLRLGWPGPRDWSLINYLRRELDAEIEFQKPWDEELVLAPASLHYNPDLWNVFKWSGSWILLKRKAN